MSLVVHTYTPCGFFWGVIWGCVEWDRLLLCSVSANRCWTGKHTWSSKWALTNISWWSNLRGAIFSGWSAMYLFSNPKNGYCLIFEEESGRVNKQIKRIRGVWLWMLWVSCEGDGDWGECDWCRGLCLWFVVRENRKRIEGMLVFEKHCTVLITYYILQFWSFV